MIFYNTLTKKLDVFKPLKNTNGHVHMYHCGPTVYNFAHIGNLRSYVFADTLRRALELETYSVNQVINITDVGHLTNDTSDQGQDKVEAGAKRENKTVREIIDFYTKAFLSDLQSLNVRTEGTKFPKATEHIDDQIDLIQTLEEKGYTYTISDGVYFDTSKFKEYGKLGHIDLANLEEGARIAKNPEKRNPTDFALWKFSPKPTDKSTDGKIENTAVAKRQQEWNSPWGIGFPGWHIECSAMAMKYLGETFDIHTGGIDHIPVHHNNEIAQSEAATGKQYVKYWMHNEFVNIEGDKMSKSKGNFMRLKTLEDAKIHPLSYRYWLLTAHYRSPIIFSFEAVQAAQNAFETLLLKIAAAQQKEKDVRTPFAVEGPGKNEKFARVALGEFLGKDLDTPGAIAYLHEFVADMTAGKRSVEELKYFDEALGLRLLDLASYMTEVPEKIKKLSMERENFRTSNNWAESDRIRKEIENMGYIVSDTAVGTKIHRPLSSLIGVL